MGDCAGSGFGIELEAGEQELLAARVCEWPGCQGAPVMLSLRVTSPDIDAESVTFKP